MKYTLRAECTHDIEQFKHVMVVGAAPTQSGATRNTNKELT